MDASAVSRGKSPAADDAADVEQIQAPHVLIVDDDSICRAVHSALFKKHYHSCKVTAAASGLQALAYLGLVDDSQASGTQTPVAKVNLVCSDYNIPPGMSGYELLKKIKESDTTKNVPVVIVSSDVEMSRINECMEAGAAMFISKPLKSADVENLARTILPVN